MRIGLVQTRGIGDIIIALPIAQFFVNRGHEVFWPIDARFVSSFQAASPNIRFLPVSAPVGSRPYFVDEPMRQLRSLGCDTIHVLYSQLGTYEDSVPVARPELVRHLKFDEYKYAVAQVPFAEKWRLSLRRDHDREARLLAQVVQSEPYAVAHREGSEESVPSMALRQVARGLPIIEIRPLTDNVFDWLRVIERASCLLMIDSCYANLVEQLGIQVRKYLWLISPAFYTPVYRNGWEFRSLVVPRTQLSVKYSVG